VEGYLAHKWGLTLTYGTNTPLTIPGCQLWLDGADINGNGSAFSVGGTISTWVDKSSLGNNMTGTSVTYTYDSIFRANAPTFNGSSSVFNQANSGLYSLNNATTWTIFTVNRRTDTSWYNAVYNAKSPGSGQNNYLIYRYSPSAGGFQFYLGDTTGSYIGSGSGTGDGITTLTARTSGTAEGFINGLSIGTGSTSSSSGQATFTIGLQTGAYMNGFIFEVLVYNVGLTTTQRQTIEGYLARKWGLTISNQFLLTHPFNKIPPASAPMIIGLVNRWIFNNGSGSTVRDTIGGQNISLSGTYTWSSSVPNSEIAKGSLSFDGYSGFGSAPINATLQTSTYTMTLWYYHTGNSDPRGNNPIIIESGLNQNEAFAIATGGFSGTSKPYFYSSVYNGGFYRPFSSATPLNTWTHLAVTIGNSRYNGYQNGVLDSGNTNISITSGLPFTLNGSFIFGKGDNAYGDQFGGSIFDVRIYNRALSASEISQIYNGIG
jgi:hypothetical protein